MSLTPLTADAELAEDDLYEHENRAAFVVFGSRCRCRWCLQPHDWTFGEAAPAVDSGLYFDISWVQ